MIRLGEEVAAALDRGAGVVALESTIIAHGLPRPRNLAVAAQLEDAVRAGGAVPATIAVLEGEPVVGVDAAALEVLAAGEGVAKLSARDLPLAAATRTTGATTVAATAHLAARAGIRVFATGGLGGVHRGARDSWDESADLVALASTPIAVVAAGVKSILDVGATLERLESLGVSVAGWRTTRFPGFYLADSGFEVPWRLETAEQAAAALAASTGSALVVANPVAADRQLDRELHDRVLAEGLALAAERGVTGKDVTPFLLAHLHEATGGRSLEVNVELAVSNARVAGEIAAAFAARR